MIETIHIENIALIESLDIDLSDGMNVLTGETGAGKSIIIDSIGMLLGNRAARELIRTGKKSAYVSAIVGRIPDEVVLVMKELGIEPDENGQVFIEREIFLDGKNVCRINSRTATASLLKKISPYLINIHGQHDASSLMKPESHIRLLDAFAKLSDELSDYAEKYRKCREISKTIEQMNIDEHEKARRMDYLRFCIDEIESAELTVGEDEELALQKKKITNAKKITSALDISYDMLYGGSDGSESAYNLVHEAKGELESLKNADDEISKYADRLESVSLEIEDIALSLSALKAEFDFTDDDIDDIILRQDEISKLKRKYSGSVEEILAFCENCKNELDDIVFADAKRERLEKELSAAQKELADAAKNITDKRCDAARRLEQGIMSKLSELDMARVKFEVHVDTECDVTKYTNVGADKVEFLISPNPGEKVKPLAKIASGGELSRIMLAMINVLFDAEPVDTLVFDEIDTGISGRAAAKVARALYEISLHRQVLCVTHLAQLALMADSHFYIEKNTVDESTRTSVYQLSEEERLNEIARITGGDKITELSLNNAKEMLLMAATQKSEIKNKI